MAAESYSQILTKGVKSDLNNTAIVDGILRYTTDTGELFLDIKDDTTSTRLKISDIDNSKTEEQIFDMLAPLPKIYVSSDTHRAYVSSGLGMVDLAEINLDVASVIDKDSPLWFTDSSDDATNNPKYSTDATYNASTKTLKAPNITVSSSMVVNGMKITDTITDGVHTVDFSFA